MAAKKVQVCITIDEDLMGWIEKKIETRDFHNKSHAFELGIAKLQHMDAMRNNLLLRDDGSVVVKTDGRKTRHKTIEM
jgi:hypothetical protein